MKIFLLIGIALHGLIHFSGFGRLWGILDPKGITARTLFLIPLPTQKVLGLFWLITLLLFLLAAALLFQNNRYWWILLIAGISVSQILIIIYWRDAKAGTLVNALLCIPVVIALGSRQFDQYVDKEIKHLSAMGIREQLNDTITSASIKDLPYCVQKWLTVSGAVGRKRAQMVYLTQKGRMRTDLKGAWMNARAQQVFNLNDPGFVWKVKVNADGLIWYSGRDKLERGSGNMLIKLYSLIPIVNSSGPEIDQGTLLRFLGELCWIPSAATSPYISWEPVGERAAKAIIHFNGRTSEGIFTYDANGNILSFSAERYMSKDGKYELERWYIPCHEWAVMDGYKIPVKGDVVWKLKEGDFVYYKWEVETIRYL